MLATKRLLFSLPYNTTCGHAEFPFILLRLYLLTGTLSVTFPLVQFHSLASIHLYRLVC